MGQVCDLSRFLPRSAKKSGEHWSKNFGDLEV